MTAYKIDFLTNNTQSTLITSTGKISDGIPAGGFYGTDRFGQPKIFTWTAKNGATWRSFYSTLQNGYQFKFKITQYWQEGGWEKSIEQIESNVFITRDRPEIDIQRSVDATFSELQPFPNGATLPASIGYFVGIYSQKQGAPIREIRWQVAQWEDGKVGELLDDTGEVDTPTLEYSFDGFFVGNSYAIRCFGKADFQTFGTQDFDSGWRNFTVKVTDVGIYAGNFTVHCLKKENAALLMWENSGAIPAKVSPDEYTPSIVDGSVDLQSDSSITWDHEIVIDDEEGRKEIPMQYASPWTAALKFMPQKEERSQSEQVTGSATERVSYRENVMAYPKSQSVQDNRYVTEFVIEPIKPYAQVSLTMPVSITLTGPASLVSYTQKSNADGSLTVTTTTTGRPTRAQIGVSYVGFIYSATIQTDYDVSNYSVERLGPSTIDCEIQKSGYRSLNVKLYASHSGYTASATLSIQTYHFVTQGELLRVTENGLSLKLEDKNLNLYDGEDLLGGIDIPTASDEVVGIVTPDKLQAISYITSSSRILETAISYAQKEVSSVAIFGGTIGTMFNCVSVYQGNGENIGDLYLDDSDFEPVWNDPSYKLYMSVNFDTGILDGGVGTSVSIGFKIYRQEIGSEILTPIATVPSTVVSLKDYGIRSRRSYIYSLYAYDSNQAFMQSVKNQTVVSVCFNNYSLLVCDYNSEDGAYHVRKQYLFSLNLSAGSEGNNNTPTLSANFTPYPTRMPSTQNYASGTLQGLIGVIYTVPALIEETYGYRHMAKPSTMDYFDSVDLEQELKDLSVTTLTLFMRDMKGHLRMVATNNQITMTPDLKKRQMPLTMSFPWVEIGDASDVTIIQTPQDEGWDDGALLDVPHSYDEETGTYSADYPKPYSGVRFYLAGAKGVTRRG